MARRITLQRINTEKRNSPKRGELMKSFLRYSAVSLVLLGLTAGLITAAVSKNTEKKDIVTAQLPMAAIVKKENSKLPIIVFSDYQCPACRELDPQIKKVEQQHHNDVSLTFRNYPLPQHKNAMVAAYAAEAAASQGKFLAMHDKLFASQDAWSESDNATSLFTQYARSIGADVEKFKQDMNSKRVKDKVAEDLLTGDKAGLEETPTVFLNGKAYSGKKLSNLEKVTNDAISGTSRKES